MREISVSDAGAGGPAHTTVVQDARLVYGCWWNGHGIGYVYPGGVDPMDGETGTDDAEIVEGDYWLWKRKALAAAHEIIFEAVEVAREAALFDADRMARGTYTSEESEMARVWPIVLPVMSTDGTPINDPRARKATEEQVTIVEIITDRPRPAPAAWIALSRARSELRRWAVRHLARSEVV